MPGTQLGILPPLLPPEEPLVAPPSNVFAPPSNVLAILPNVFVLEDAAFSDSVGSTGSAGLAYSSIASPSTPKRVTEPSTLNIRCVPSFSITVT
jgi:hypothetical protein